MSKGSERITIRVGAELRAEIQRQLDKREKTPTIEPWKVTDWVIAAIMDKLNHAERSRGSKIKHRSVKVDEHDPRAYFKDGRGDWEEADRLPAREDGGNNNVDISECPW